MAGAACKVIINNQVHGLSAALEIILTDPSIHRGRLPDDKRLQLLQRLADVDLGAYKGVNTPKGGLGGILLELETCGLVTAEVWEVLRRPGT